MLVIIVNPKTGKAAGMISDETYKFVSENAERLDSAIIYERDFNYNLYVLALMCQTVRVR